MCQELKVNQYPHQVQCPWPHPSWLIQVLPPYPSPCANSYLQLLPLLQNFPDHPKQAQFSPILKKFNLYLNAINDYHPISNLPFVSELVEKAVVKQLTAYMTENNLFEPYLPAYHSDHSTETALLRVLDNLPVTLDNHSQVSVSLPDCSAMFGLIDHNILLARMKTHLGLSGLVLNWFESYLSNRIQCLHIWSQVQLPSPQLRCPSGLCAWPHPFYNIYLTNQWHRTCPWCWVPSLGWWYAVVSCLWQALMPAVHTADSWQTQGMHCWYLAMDASKQCQTEWE